jgi:flagellar motor switch protein FliM
MNGNYGVIKNETALKIVREYNAFIKETQAKIDETRRAMMLSLKKLLKLQDGDVIEIQEDDTLRVVPAQEDIK